MVRCRWASGWVLALLLVALVAAPAAVVATPRSGDQATPLPGWPALTATAAGRQLAWLLEELDGTTPISTSAVRSHFSADVLAALPPDQLVADLQARAAQLAPVRLGRLQGPTLAGDVQGILLSGTAGQWQVNLSVEPQPPNRITALTFTPDPPAALPGGPTAWAALDQQFATLAPGASLVAAELGDGGCAPIHALNATAPLGIASGFKVYVLGALAYEVAQGHAAWSEPLAIHDAWKSLPEGDLRLEPAGTSHPLQFYAEQMIAMSDNTAADHLIHRLGRAQVEGVQWAMGSSDAARNEPFLTTREFFLLKSRLSDAQLAAYVQAPVATKRALLASEIDPIAVTEADDEWTMPLRISTVEWFASALDLCRAMTSLQMLAGQPGLDPIAAILSLQPADPLLAHPELDARVWTYVGYKAGDETGVMSRAFLLRRADGRWFVLTAILNDPRQPVNEANATALLLAAIHLLATTT